MASSFNPTNGCIGNLCPPFSSNVAFEAYTDALKNANMNSFQVVTMLNNKSGQPANLTSSKFPSVQVVVFGTTEPAINSSSTLAISYQNPSGNSMFAYKNDPANQISLITNGVAIAPQLNNAVQTVATKTGVPTGFWIFLYVVMFLIFIGIMLLTLSTKKPYHSNF